MQVLAMWMLALTLGVAPSLAEAAVDAACGMDRFEPNDQRARAKSTRGKPVEGRVCDGDTDWSTLKLDAGSTVDVVVEAADGAALDVGFFPPRSRKPQGKTTRSAGRTVVRYRVTDKAKHRVRVTTKSGKPVAYSLKVEPAR